MVANAVPAAPSPTAVPARPAYTVVFGQGLLALMGAHPQVVAITAAMPSGTGTGEVAKAYPSRFFDVGIAEGHAVTFAAGLATLVLTLVGGALLVLDVAVNRSFAITTSIIVGLVLTGLWFVLPIPLLRHQIQEEDRGDADNPIDNDDNEPPPGDRVAARS